MNRFAKKLSKTQGFGLRFLKLIHKKFSGVLSGRHPLLKLVRFLLGGCQSDILKRPYEQGGKVLAHCENGLF